MNAMSDPTRGKTSAASTPGSFAPHTRSAGEVGLGASPTPEQLATVRQALAETELLYCTRVSSAWGYGTMHFDDFAPAAEDDDIVREMSEAIVASGGRDPGNVRDAIAEYIGRAELVRFVGQGFGEGEPSQDDFVVDDESPDIIANAWLESRI